MYTMELEKKKTTIFAVVGNGSILHPPPSCSIFFRWQALFLLNVKGMGDGADSNDSKYVWSSFIEFLFYTVL
jgi:hypothetical protein